MWAPGRQAGRIWFWLDCVTEPVLGACRDVLNSLFKFIGIDTRSFLIDFSPMLALALVDIVRRAALIALRAGVIFWHDWQRTVGVRILRETIKFPKEPGAWELR